MGAASCLACRVLRRFVLAFIAGAFLAWQFKGQLPTDLFGGAEGQGLMMVAILFSGLSVFMRMRQMRARWKR